MQRRDAAVEFLDVAKDYAAPWPGRRRVRAVQGVSLRVEPGEALGLLGPNRSGKTTLVKLLLSLGRPTSGRVVRLGRPATDRETLARVGYVHEAPTFPGHLSAAGLLAFYGGLALVPPASLRHRIPELLGRVGLADRGGEPIAGYSKGMVQRLALAQALLNDPDLLVLDEPGEGLDLDGRRLLADLIAERRRLGRSVLLVTHALDDVPRLCDRVAVLLDGRIVQDGPAAPTGRHPKRPLEQSLREIYARAGR